MNYEKLMSRKNSDGKDAVDFLNEASDLMDKDEFKNAVDLLTEAIGLCGHPRLYFNRGYCHYQMKDFKNAINDFTKSIASDRGSDLLAHEKQRLYLYMGIINEEMEENDKAVDAYKKAADWGYAGAIARLEKMGVTYIPQPIKESSEPDNTQQKNRAKQKNSATLESKPKSASGSGAASSDAPVKKSKFRFVLPAIIGIIFGIGAFLLLRNIPETAAVRSIAKKSAITAVVTSDTLNLRAEPFAYAEVLKVLYNGYVVEIKGDALNDFTPVEHEGVKGWVDSEFIDSRLR